MDPNKTIIWLFYSVLHQLCLDKNIKYMKVYSDFVGFL
jgi:hypothetical protein